MTDKLDRFNQRYLPLALIVLFFSIMFYVIDDPQELIHPPMVKGKAKLIENTISLQKEGEKIVSLIYKDKRDTLLFTAITANTPQVTVQVSDIGATSELQTDIITITKDGNIQLPTWIPKKTYKKIAETILRNPNYEAQFR